MSFFSIVSDPEVGCIFSWRSIAISLIEQESARRDQCRSQDCAIYHPVQ
jgi:hypothetical protein